ncbi:L-rhamnose catabolism isomerase [Bradyrhizobium guangzhouense]|uniref:L-rhamnose catabolism isomerase n=1 Tax=Bradyrhizobium guangzhouense TaxID=1325095 RepID=UPI001009B396|nr:L-rhamnose catabolism isomerase [Bradyrhizobium guangzhouense]RXH18916.1 L-rhamnose catabolism isomerase [Bradyrhizobium guangzhouense]
MIAKFSISADFIAEQNERLEAAINEDYDALKRALGRHGIDADVLVQKVMAFGVAIPTWGVGTGGTRFARFPGPGEPRNVVEKIDDCAVIQQLARATPTISPHFPWDKVDDYAALREQAASHGLAFDAVNSNTFQDQPGQEHSYKLGSLSHTDARVRAQAIAHNFECIEIGRKLGSKALTVWIADGSNFAGQSNLTKALDRYIDAMREIVAALPADWRVFLEHKLYEPAFYSTVISDWGTSFAVAQELGPKAHCLVDLGHHAPNVNIEQVVARLVRFNKLAGFHFNDSKYGDDDLDSGSVEPFRLFLVFNELIDAERRKLEGFAPAYMIDQSHNVTDPIESLMQSAIELQRAYAQALIVDRAALEAAQEANDALGAHLELKRAFTTDVSPLLAVARMRAGGAIAPIAAYRASGYRARKASERPAVGGTSAGIV